MLLISLSNLKAQVGIGTTTPQGALDIESTNDGLLIPRVSLTATTVSAPVITPTVSELVYNINTAGDVTPGYYYWNGTVWVRLNNAASDDWTLIGNSGTNPSTNFLGTTDAQDLVIKTNNNTHMRFFNANGATEIGNAGITNSRLNIDVPSSNTSLLYGLRSYLRGTTTISNWGAYIRNDATTSGSNKYGMQVYTSPNTINNTRTYGSYFQTYSPNVANTARFTGMLNESFIQFGAISGSENIYALHNSIAAHSSIPITTSGRFFGLRNDIDVANASSTTSMFGVYSSSDFVGTGTKIGIANTMDVSTGDTNTVGTAGIYNRSFVRGTGATALIAPDGTSASRAGHFGIYNQVRLQNFSGTPAGIYGMLNEVETNAGTAVYPLYGIRNRVGTSSLENVNGAAYGVYTSFQSSGNGTRYGSYIDYNLSPTSGTGDKYGFVYFAPTALGGTHYGVWSSALKAGSYAGYFLGNVSIGTTTANNYIMPASRGTVGQIMVTDGAGNVSWTNASTSNAWSTSGNSGTSAATNFIGTSDNVSLNIRTNNTNRINILNTGQVAVNGTAVAGDDFAVYGTDFVTNSYTSTAAGVSVYAQSSGANGTAVFGAANSGTGVQGRTNAANGIGAFGRNTNATGTGVVGAGQGIAPATLVAGAGTTGGGTTSGLYGFATDVTSGWGIRAVGNNILNPLSIAGGGGGAFTGNQWGVNGNSTISGSPATDRASFLGAYNNNTSAENVYVGARIGNVHYKILGTGGGSVSTTMDTRDGERVMFAPESPENWFFDMGEVQLVNGKATVQLDPLFVDMISDAKPFKVFVQGAEDTQGSIRITRNQQGKSFTLEDLGGQSNGTVQFSVYAIWKNKAGVRMPKYENTTIIEEQKIENLTDIEIKKKKFTSVD